MSRGVALSIDNIISGSLTMTKEDKKCRDPDDNPDKTNLVCALPSCSGKIADTKLAGEQLTRVTKGIQILNFALSTHIRTAPV